MRFENGAANSSYKRPSNYEWLRYSANDSPIKQKDVMSIFNISSNGLRDRVVSGDFPAKDATYKKSALGVEHDCWKKQTIVNEIVRVEALIRDHENKVEA